MFDKASSDMFLYLVSQLDIFARLAAGKSPAYSGDAGDTTLENGAYHLKPEGEEGGANGDEEGSAGD